MNDNERRKLLADSIMREYSSLREEIVARLGYQSTITQYALVFTAALIAAISAVPSLLSDKVSLVFLLLTPWIFFLLALSFQEHNLVLSSLGEYINQRLRPLMAQASGSPQKDIWGWEEFFHHEKASLRQDTIGNARYWLLGLMTLAPSLLLFWAKTAGGVDWDPLHWALFVVDLIIGVVVFADFVVTRRYFRRLAAKIGPSLKVRR